jgi:hypothetical protein
MKNANYLGWMSVACLVCLGMAGCSSGAPSESVGEQQAELRGRRICEGPSHLTCAKNQFCDALRPGLCPGECQVGVCASRPRVCTDIFDPVCGCDGNTYPNACNAAAVGVAVASRGACATNGQFCGGIAGIPCPDGQTCVDDPSDDCDPQNGGADCGGICVEKKDTFCGGIAGIPCPDGQTCVDDPSDDCDPKNGGADCGGICVGSGETCGNAVCSPGLVCCNPLLGICTPPGGVCPL